MNKSIFSVLLAGLLWNNTLGQNSPNPAGVKYVQECAAKHPGATNITQNLGEFQNYYCFWYCTGYEKNGSFFIDITKTEDTTTCEPYINLYLKEKITDTYQCHNQQCLLNTEWELCKSSLKNTELKNLEAKECSVSCTGKDNSIVSATKQAGDFCQIVGNYDPSTKCNEKGFCLGKPNYVKLPKGAFNATFNAAQAVCFDQNNGSKDPETYIDNNDACRFNCVYFNATGLLYIQLLSFNDGTPCIGDKKCLNGKCLDPAVIDTCKANTKRIEVSECNVRCWSDTDLKTTTLPVNSTCLKNYYFNGTCDAQGQCNAISSYGR